MELIPVIDVLNSIVVKAFAGERKKYKPIQSKILDSHNLDKVIEFILNEYDFKRIYIADLNAIMGKKDNFLIINKIIKKYPQIDFWVDYGIKTYIDSQKFNSVKCTLVIGSETLQDVLELKKISRKREIVLSLDYKNDIFLGPKYLISKETLWPKKIILMFLDNVGSNKGPNLDKLKKIKFDSKKEIYLAGGIRNNKDICLLKKMGIKGVLLSSAIHEKKIIYKEL